MNLATRCFDTLWCRSGVEESRLPSCTFGWKQAQNGTTNRRRDSVVDLNIAVSLIDLGPGFAGPGRSLPFLLVIPHLLRNKKNATPDAMTANAQKDGECTISGCSQSSSVATPIWGKEKFCLPVAKTAAFYALPAEIPKLT